MDDVAHFALLESSIEALEAEELLEETRARKASQPAIPHEVQRQIDAFRNFRS